MDPIFVSLPYLFLSFFLLILNESTTTRQECNNLSPIIELGSFSPFVRSPLRRSNIKL